MGTFNYKTSDYITLAFRPYDYSDFEADKDFLAEHEEYAPEMPLYDYAIDTIKAYEEEDYLNIKHELQKHSFHYFHVVQEIGYYEGSQLIIEPNYGVAYDTWQDKREAQKELTELKAFLIECAGMGMVKTCPHWCPSYADYNETIKAINAAIREAREDVRNTPTWATYERG